MATSEYTRLPRAPGKPPYIPLGTTEAIIEEYISAQREWHRRSGTEAERAIYLAGVEDGIRKAFALMRETGYYTEARPGAMVAVDRFGDLADRFSDL